MLASLQATASSSDHHDRNIVDRVNFRVAGFSMSEDQCVIEQRSAAFACRRKYIDKASQRLHHTAIEPECFGLIPEVLINGFFMRQRVVRVRGARAAHA